MTLGFRLCDYVVHDYVFAIFAVFAVWFCLRLFGPLATFCKKCELGAHCVYFTGVVLAVLVVLTIAGMVVLTQFASRGWSSAAVGGLPHCLLACRVSCYGFTAPHSLLQSGGCQSFWTKPCNSWSLGDLWLAGPT